MTHPSEIPNPALDAVLIALGTQTLLKAQGNPERVDEIFNSTVMLVMGRYPHHKLLAHLCDAAKDGMVEDYIDRHRGMKDLM